MYEHLDYVKTRVQEVAAPDKKPDWKRIQRSIDYKRWFVLKMNVEHRTSNVDELVKSQNFDFCSL